MELVSKKVLILLCGLFFMAAEGFLLYRNEAQRNSRPSQYLEFDPSNPFAFNNRSFMTRGLFPKDFMKGWGDDSFFKNRFSNDNFLSESFTLIDPKREDRGSEVRLVFDIKGHEKGKFDVKVSEGQLTLIGNDEQKTTESDKSFLPWHKKTKEPKIIGETHWSQTQSFPLPDDIDPKSYSIERTKNQLVVIFKKSKVDGQSNSDSAETL
jgi:HSP20 family molecular chaperone IbpA